MNKGVLHVHSFRPCRWSRVELKLILVSCTYFASLCSQLEKFRSLHHKKKVQAGKNCLAFPTSEWKQSKKYLSAVHKYAHSFLCLFSLFSASVRILAALKWCQNLFPPPTRSVFICISNPFQCVYALILFYPNANANCDQHRAGDKVYAKISNLASADLQVLPYQFTSSHFHS